MAGTPSGWSTLASLISTAKGQGVAAGSAIDFYAADCITAYCSNGFLSVYNETNQHWSLPAGVSASNPYLAAVTHSFSGRYILQQFDSNTVGPIFQSQSPDWRTFFSNWAAQNIKIGSKLVFVDGNDQVFTSFMGGGWGCNDTWEGADFIQDLNSTFSASQLASLGITNLGDFCMKDYVSQKFGAQVDGGDYYTLLNKYPSVIGLETVSLTHANNFMQDPIVKEYLLYQYKSYKEFVSNFTESFATAAGALGSSAILNANQGPIWTPGGAVTGHYMGVADFIASRYFPVIFIEPNEDTLPPFQGEVAACKAALASGNYTKPVWIDNHPLVFQNPFGPSNPPGNISAYLQLRAAETYAAGCVDLPDFNIGVIQSTATGTERLVNGDESNAVAAYFRFVADHTNLFQNISTVSRVALVYSIPDVAWNYFPTFRIFPDYQTEVGGWARALEMSHVPYDIVPLGMKDIYNDQNLNSLLSKYDVVIAPGVKDISNTDLGALGAYANQGGKVLVTDGFASYDDTNSPRSAAAVTNFMSEPGVTTIPSGIASNFQNELLSGSLDQAILTQLQAILFQDLPRADRVLTDAPPTVYISPMTQNGNQRIIIHVVNLNYGYNSSDDWTTPTNVRFNMTLPYNSNSWTVTMSTPDGSGASSFSYSMTGDVLSVTIPNLKLWDIITLQPAQQKTTTTVTSYLTSTFVSTNFVTTGASTVRTTEQATTTLNHTVTATVLGPTSITEVFGMLALGGVIGALITIYAVRRWRFSPTS